MSLVQDNKGKRSWQAVVLGVDEGEAFRGHWLLDSNECPGHAAPKPAREACSTRKCRPLPSTPSSWGPQGPVLPGSERGHGGHLQGELDPVAESSEEAEAASGSSKLSFAPPPVSSRLEQLGPMEEVSGQGLGSR